MKSRAVLGHEMTHVSCGDMVTLSLVQGVLNTFVIFFSRLAANVINSALSSDDEEGGLGFFGYMAVTIVLELVLGSLPRSSSCGSPGKESLPPTGVRPISPAKKRW